MKTISGSAMRLGMFACLSVCALHAQATNKGQDFPGTTCTCKNCGTDSQGRKTDVTGQCPAVCKDKTVYSKGSEPHDYCKAARTRIPVDIRSDELARTRESRPH